VADTDLTAAAALSRSGKRTVWVSAGILAVSAAAWIATVAITGAMTMPEMEASALDALAFCGVWGLMMAAMMLPSALLMFSLYSRMAGSVPSGFVAGYLVDWTLAGAIAYLAYALPHGSAVSMFEISSLGRPTAIVLVLAAAVYQITPLKNACLRHCRSPLAFILNHWHHGLGGALRMGLEHGLWCLGCCAGLMALLFGVGVMNVAWMVILAGVILAEKALPGGLWIARAASVGMVALAVGFAVSPEFYRWASMTG
jgi:predicted metal-binding membrane protein